MSLRLGYTEIAGLQGSDSGSIDPTILNTKLNVVNIAPAESSVIASQSYFIDDLVVYENDLYKAIDNIASGSEFAPSTNIVLTTIEGELGLRTKSSTLSSVEYAALKSAGTLDSNTIYFITDDYIPIEEEINEAIESALATIPSLIDEAVNSAISTAEFSNNKVTALSSAVTDDQYPSALSVWTLFNSITNANEVSY